MDRLPALLTTEQFPEPELQALGLDGEVYLMDSCAASIDQPQTVALRAQVLRTILPPRLIVELESAAWVWGALHIAPQRHSVCADAAARARPTGAIPIRFREVVFDVDDVTAVNGLRLTTPLRTAVDLARFADDWTPSLSATVRRLIELGDSTAEECMHDLRKRSKLPRKILALSRLAASTGPPIDGALDAGGLSPS